jgi:hypothetical protein
MSLQKQFETPANPTRIVTAPFVVAVTLLGIAVFLAGPVAGWLQIKHGKKALPLKAPLSQLNESAIAPYRVVQREILDPSLVEALDTDRYLSWVLEDTSVPAADPLRQARLLVTYYSGGHNLVPHTPDVCYVGGGYRPAQPHENLSVEIPALGSGASKVPIRVCTFAKTAVFDHQHVSVVYTFYCNGWFSATRTRVRVLINSPINTYAYFSKVEVSFPRATRAENIKGGEKLFDRLLPELVRNHWPDFEKAERAASEPSADGG